eukprot:CAMPEP_0197724662 /NCGR_PEP_ID=MMETSP1434-20131217/6493_1 /TAXON_ID=265543 /ORGANISM="Minutocellus polymorphus, Strain CCMP3303" /LENGTH=153 /DNA_ID=CAMNT_0043310043 /DNA_START=198 /DNA_END=655 /DNA_ORIENTATION=-
MAAAGPALSEQDSHTFKLILAHLDRGVDDSPLNDLGARRSSQRTLVRPKIHGTDHIVDLLESHRLVDVAIAISALCHLLPFLDENLHPGVVSVRVGAKHERNGNDGIIPILRMVDAVLSLELLPTDGVLGGDHQFGVTCILLSDASGNAAGWV